MDAAWRLLAAWSCLWTIPSDILVCDAVDLVELNHCYNDQAEPVFDQLIFWDWCEAAGRFQVRDWRMAKSPQMRPQRDWARGGWLVLWCDGAVLRQVHAAAFRETWTQYDPEMEERSRLPVEARRKLAPARRLTFLRPVR